MRYRILRAIRPIDVPANRKTRKCLDCKEPITAQGGKKRCPACSMFERKAQDSERRRRA